jgi:hypothetical protein
MQLKSQVKSALPTRQASICACQCFENSTCGMLTDTSRLAAYTGNHQTRCAVHAELHQVVCRGHEPNWRSSTRPHPDADGRLAACGAQAAADASSDRVTCVHRVRMPQDPRYLKLLIRCRPVSVGRCSRRLLCWRNSLRSCAARAAQRLGTGRSGGFTCNKDAIRASGFLEAVMRANWRLRSASFAASRGLTESAGVHSVDGVAQLVVGYKPGPEYAGFSIFYPFSVHF